MHYASISLGFLSLTCFSPRPTARLAEDSFSPIPSVETHHVSSKNLSHDGCHGSISGPQKQLHVVGHHSPCVVWRINLLQQTRQPFEKFLPVLVIFENRFTFYSSNDDMVQGTDCVYAGLAGHTFQLRDSCSLVNKETTSLSSELALFACGVLLGCYQLLNQFYTILFIVFLLLFKTSVKMIVCQYHKDD
jgi:hypothetical protein